MIRVFVDANVFLRLFAGDDPVQREKAARLIQKAKDGKVHLVSGPPVLFEVAWTLRSKYRQPLSVVLDVLQSILATAGIEIPDRPLVDEAIRMSRESGVDFADSYIAASAQASSCDAIASFNRNDFKRLGMSLVDL